MKSICLLSFLYFQSFNVFSQNSQNDYNYLIDSAIGLTMKYQQLVWKPDSLIDLSIVDENEYPYIGFHSQKIKSFCLACPNGKENLLEGNNIWKIIPSLNGGRFTVFIIHYIVNSESERKKGIIMSRTGASKTVFSYSTKKKIWMRKEYSNYGH